MLTRPDELRRRTDIISPGVTQECPPWIRGKNCGLEEVEVPEKAKEGSWRRNQEMTFQVKPVIYEVLFYLRKKVFLPEEESKQGKKDRAWPVATLFSKTFTDSFRF